MTLLSPQHFDAPRPPSTIVAALRLIAERWAPCSALVIVTALLMCTGALAVVAAAAVRDWSDAALRATPLVAVLDAQATAADAEATGAQLRSIPGVVDAVFRSRDDALTDLVARGLPVPDGRNPLPDAWTLHLRADVRGAGPGERLAAARRAVEAVPHVAATRLDARHVADLDRVETWRRRAEAPLVIGVVVMTGIVALCTGLLAGGSLAPSESVAAKWSPTLVALLAIVVATVLAAGALVVAGRSAGEAFGSAAPFGILALIEANGNLGTAAWFVVAIMLLAGMVAGASRR